MLGRVTGYKEAGALQVEGKDCVAADGDIRHLRFNV